MAPLKFRSRLQHGAARFFLLVVVVLGANLAGGSKSTAAIYAGPQAGWLVVSSHSHRQEGIATARQYADNFPGVLVFEASNGYFAVSLGWVDKASAKPLIRRLKSDGYIPHDSYVHNGQRWWQAIWSANNAHHYDGRQFLAASALVVPPQISGPSQASPGQGQVVAIQPTSALVANLDQTDDKFLSLRHGPDTSFAEILRMRSGTKLTITGKTGRWYYVKLNDGTVGFAYSKYVEIAPVPIVGPQTTPGNDVRVVGPEPGADLPENPELADAHQDADVDTRPNHDENIDVLHEKRVALVLGNSDYLHTAPLANPKNDADAMSAKLKELGFTVISGLDLGKAEMEVVIREFVRELEGADVALFFYAGHAMQVNGTNYLIPVNAALEDSTAIDFETINFNVILDFMNSDDRTSIALLDACRNNPLARNFTKKLSKSRSAFVGRGLAVPSSSEGQMLIGFATAPGEVALDGEGKNSPFTTALLRHIDAPGLEIELMLKRVKADVYKDTEGSQSPWNNSALRKEFYFADKQD